MRVYTFNADGTQAEVALLDDKTRSATLQRLSEEGAAITIVFNISAGVTVNGAAYIMVVNGDTPVRYYPYKEGVFDAYTFPEVITDNDNFAEASYVDLDNGTATLYDASGNKLDSVSYAQGSNFIAVEGAGTLTFVNTGNAAVESSITYQEGDYVLE